MRPKAKTGCVTNQIVQPHLALLTNVGRRPLGFWPHLHSCNFSYFIGQVSKNTSLNCDNTSLTTIDHKSPGDNKIFVTCDASDWHIGATLSFGQTWETVQPVASNS